MENREIVSDVFVALQNIRGDNPRRDANMFVRHVVYEETLKNTGLLFGVSTERVRQICYRCNKTIMLFLVNKYGEDCYGQT